MSPEEVAKKYDHKSIEQKWQKKWEEDATYKTIEDSPKPKQFILDMFPYPSGEGLHVGHPRGYIATDVYSRKKRMEGFNVLHPMGWDAFGLPAENFAIKNKVHPSIAVEKNVSRFKEQLSIIGLDYDWSHEISTTDPNFYKWTQWIFLQMYKKGLAYESNEPVNWCPTDKTVLANEDVEPDGTCERCGTKVEKRPMRQWVLKITDYADRLLADLDKLPKWPDGVKEAQRNWIGKSQGAEIDFIVEGQESHPLKIFTTRPDTIFGATFIAVSAGLAKSWQNMGWAPSAEIVAYINETLEEESVRDFKEKEKTGIYSGFEVVNPATKEKIPVWIANYVLSEVGTGAIMAVPAHDKRDFEFAKKYNLPVKQVVEIRNKINIKQIVRGNGVGTSHMFPTAFQYQLENIEDVFFYEEINGDICDENLGIVSNSGHFDGLTSDEAKDKITEFVGGKIKSTYKIKDWVFSRQRYWGEPIPIIHCEKCGVVPVPEKDLPVVLPEVENYEPTGTGESPLANIDSWVNTICPTCGGSAKRETNTMPQWAGSSWYYLRYIDPNNSEALVDPIKEKSWMPVDVYVGGDHATRHLIYARFWHKFLFDIGVVSSEEPFPRLEFLGFILAEDGRKMSKRWKNVINPDDVVNQFGADAFRLYEMFIGPFEGTVPWSTNGLVGTYRFLERVFHMVQVIKSIGMTNETDPKIKTSLEKTIKKVTEDIEKFKFNTAVSSLMIFINGVDISGEIYDENSLTCTTIISREDLKRFLQILAPFAPHITEELWESLGESESIHLSSWPTYDPNKVVDEQITIAIQINGKARAELSIKKTDTKEDIESAALLVPKIQEYTKNKKIEKIIVVPGRIVNIVVS